MRREGWVLDVYIERNEAVLWIKTEKGQVLKTVEPYNPDLFVEPKEISSEQLSDMLRQHENIVNATVEKKHRTLDERNDAEVIHILVDQTGNFKKVLRDTEHLRFVSKVYNTDLMHVQKYLFEKGIAPMRKTGFECEGSRLLLLEPADDEHSIAPPPFTELFFRTEWDEEEAKSILLLDEDLNPTEVFKGEEQDVLEKFNKNLLTIDPDLVVCNREDLSALLNRAQTRGLELALGRETPRSGELPKGRVFIGLHTFARLGLAGIVERTLFTMAPASLSSEWQAGKTIDSRQCYEAYKHGILIPKAGAYQHQMSADNLVFRDQGGLVLSPEVGLHMNVGALDFESMFPNIIVKRNVSYETVTPQGVDSSRRGFLVDPTREVLERRLYFKHLKKSFPAGSREWLWCDQRQAALKEILVCIYGYTGCFANRFGNVVTYQEINRISRDELVRSMKIAKSRGFEVIYGDNDSLFLKKAEASSSDYESLAKEISETVGLSMVLDRHFKFLVLLNKKAENRLGAAKRYYGKLMDGSLFYRGIALRRHDSPPLIRRFQERLTEILLDADNADTVKNENVKKAWDLIHETCSTVRNGKVQLEDLVLSKVLTRPLEEYRGNLPHVVAAKQLARRGRTFSTGEIVDFIYVDTEHSNPLQRVVPASIAKDGTLKYDRKKYVALIMDAAKTLLTPIETAVNHKTLDISTISELD